MYNLSMNRTVLKLVSSQFKLDINGDHGKPHWERVEKIGLYLAKNTKSDIEVIRLFALLHDSRRDDEFDDPEHGVRAALYAEDLSKQEVLRLSKFQLKQLVYACRHHSSKKAKSDDVTVQICWDADRLDLLRLGIQPEAEYLSTDLGKKIAVERGGII